MLKTKIATDKIVNLYDEGRFKKTERELLISVLFTIIRIAMFRESKIFPVDKFLEAEDCNDNCEKNMAVIEATYSIIKGNSTSNLIQKKLEKMGVDVITLRQAWQRGWEEIAKDSLKILLSSPPVDRRINMYEVTYILNCLRRAGVKLTNVNFPLKELRQYNGKI